ncbi:MAG: hypothetical protein IJ686_06270 [Bacteroidales bacterium]|nr:hypothetical protein [Bacteroidales bacterium]
MVKKKLFSNAEAYAAPVCNVLDMKVEGVMCGSTNSANSDYDGDNDLGEI